MYIKDVYNRFVSISQNANITARAEVRYSYYAIVGVTLLIVGVHSGFKRLLRYLA